MSNVDFTTDQIVDLVLRLPSAQKKEVLIALASDSETRREERMKIAEDELRKLCSTRGLDWDRMSEDEREAFADVLIHEDRPAHGE
jgi:hypothetical protein